MAPHLDAAPELGEAELWLSSTAMAAELGCSVRTLQRLVVAGILLPGGHYHRSGFGSRSPLQWNSSAVRLALRMHTAATG